MRLRPIGRFGFSLAEVLVSIVLTILVGSLVLHLLFLQQQFFSKSRAGRESATRLHESELILSSELRFVAPSADTLRMLGDSAVEVLSLVGVSSACNTMPAADSALRLPPAELYNGNILSAFLYPPDTGDILLLFTPDSLVGSWSRHGISRVSTAPASTVCPASSGFTSPLDASAPSYIVTLRDPPGSSARGSVVRVLRRGRFSHYRSSDGQWYLGYKRCQTSACSAVQPVAGPLLPYRANSPTGLRFSYRDSAGAATSDPSGISAIDVVVRTDATKFSKITIAPRNRH